VVKRIGAIGTGEIVQRDIGTPQGGVVSPLLMNLFMHYAFDSWMRREIPNCSFARYADDAVVHCRSRDQAQRLIKMLSDRFAECGLELHPDKTGYVYTAKTVTAKVIGRKCSSLFWALRFVRER